MPPAPRRLTSEGRGAWGAEADVQTAPPGTTAPRRRVHPGPGPTLTWIPSRPALSTTRSFHFRVIRFDRTGPKKKKSVLTYALNAESEDPGVTMERDAQHSWPHPQERGSPPPPGHLYNLGQGQVLVQEQRHRKTALCIPGPSLRRELPDVNISRLGLAASRRGAIAASRRELGCSQRDPC